MATITKNGITFNSVKNSPKKFSTYPLVMKNQQGPDEDGMGIINVVDVDWNGAVLPNANITNGSSVTINTTGELLNLINEMQKEIYTLTAAVIAISQQ